MIAVKVPIGLIVLMLIGLFLFFSRRIPLDWISPCGTVLTVAILFLLVLSRGATYAGIRHTLPVVVLLSVFAGISIEMAVSSKTWQLKVFVATAFVAAVASAVPQVRPWNISMSSSGAPRTPITSLAMKAWTSDNDRRN